MQHSAPGSRSGLRSASSAGLRSQPLQSRPSRLRLGLDGRLAALAAINHELAPLGRDVRARHSGAMFGRHIAKAARSTPGVPSLTSCRGLVLYAFGLHFADDVHRSRLLRCGLVLYAFGLHFPAPAIAIAAKMLGASMTWLARSRCPPLPSFLSRSRALRLRLALRRCPPLARASC